MRADIPRDSNPVDFSGREIRFALSSEQRLTLLREMVAEARKYAREKRSGWAGWSTAIRLGVFAASAGATVTLGFAETDALGKLGFVLSAVVTSLTALESFFNLRSRWVGADVALASWYELEEEIEMNAAAAGSRPIDDEMIDDLYIRYRAVWTSWSNDWIAARKSHS